MIEIIRSLSCSRVRPCEWEGLRFYIFPEHPNKSGYLRRKRKWDQPAEAVASSGIVLPGLLPFSAAGALAGMGALQGVFPSLMGVFPTTPTSSRMSVQSVPPSNLVQQSAAAIVQKFNQDLINKGLLPQPKIQDELIAREITINDADPGVRYKLTKRQTQEEIQLKTGAVVITRGRYRPPNGPIEPEKPLYLHISAGVHLKETADRIRAVDQAAAMVEEMLKQGRQTPVPVVSSALGTSSHGTVATPLTVSIYVGFEADPSCNLVGRIRGPNDQYINHIMNETGATVILRGRGSGNREGLTSEELPLPLHLWISSDNSKSLEDAKVLAENLIETIRPSVYQSLPVPITSSLPHAPVAYLPSQPAPYQVPGYPAASLSQGLYGGYYPSLSGPCPPPYTGSQSALPSALPTAVAILPAQSASPSITSGTNPYANRFAPTKAYAAVPPPVQLLGDQLGSNTAGFIQGPAALDNANGRASKENLYSSAVIPSNLNMAIPSASGSLSAQSASHSGYPFVLSHPTDPVHLPQEVTSHISLAPASTAQLPETAITSTVGQSIPSSYTQAFQSSQGQTPLSTYSGYSGVYPQASPLQQVALALQRPPLPVSVKPGSGSVIPAPPTRAQTSSYQGRQSEKQPVQRRKFQEFPVSSGKDASGDEKQGQQGLSTSASLDASRFSQESGPLTSTQISPPPPKNMPPPPPKGMPPPPPKIVPSAALARSGLAPSVEEKSNSSSPIVVSATDLHDPAAPHGTGLKLVEYGEEEEESTERLASLSSGSAPGAAYSNGKPFWAA